MCILINVKQFMMFAMKGQFDLTSLLLQEKLCIHLTPYIAFLGRCQFMALRYWNVITMWLLDDFEFGYDDFYLFD